MNKRLIAILQALFVVFLWATSWVLIKFGLEEIPPLTFAGLRYFLAFLCLLGVFLYRDAKHQVKSLSKGAWSQLIFLGFLFYAGTQGASFVALAHLPAVTVNLLLSFSSVFVALVGIAWLSEKPTGFQWIGILLALLGAMMYFYPVTTPKSQWIGYFVAVIGIMANAVSSSMGRDINRSAEYHPLVVTVVSMGPDRFCFWAPVYMWKVCQPLG